MKWLVRAVVWWSLMMPLPAMAAESPLWEFGLRGGMEATGTKEHYKAGELYLLRVLPWHKDLGGGVLTARLDLGAGFLESREDHGGWLAAGGDLAWSFADGLVVCEVGFRPTWLTEHQFGGDDLGGTQQFTSHAGFAVRVAPVVINYRFQHTSNAGIYDDNDGLDLHLFGVGASF